MAESPSAEAGNGSFRQWIVRRTAERGVTASVSGRRFRGGRFDWRRSEDESASPGRRTQHQHRDQ
jgi:hypothetical protein